MRRSAENKGSRPSQSKLFGAKFTQCWQNKGACVETLGRVPSLPVGTTLVQDKTTYLKLRVYNITDQPIQVLAENNYSYWQRGHQDRGRQPRQVKQLTTRLGGSL